MSQSLLFAFVVFATVMFFTPGPNNVMLLSSGLTHGFRREVLRATAAIPYGRTASYRDVATRAGSPRAVRAARRR